MDFLDHLLPEPLWNVQLPVVQRPTRVVRDLLAHRVLVVLLRLSQLLMVVPDP